MGFVTGMIQYVTSTNMNNPAKSSGAVKCVRCGDCERKCPQGIKVAHAMEAVGRRMEPLLVRACIGLASKLKRA
jgi:predicted aldo/keto reductase-like oxidoreductase